MYWTSWKNLSDMMSEQVAVISHVDEGVRTVLQTKTSYWLGVEYPAVCLSFLSYLVLRWSWVLYWGQKTDIRSVYDATTKLCFSAAVYHLSPSLEETNTVSHRFLSVHHSYYIARYVRVPWESGEHVTKPLLVKSYQIRILVSKFAGLPHLSFPTFKPILNYKLSTS